MENGGIEVLLERPFIGEDPPRPAQYDLALGRETAKTVSALHDCRAEIFFELTQRRREVEALVITIGQRSTPPSLNAP